MLAVQTHTVHNIDKYFILLLKVAKLTFRARSRNVCVLLTLPLVTLEAFQILNWFTSIAPQLPVDTCG